MKPIPMEAISQILNEVMELAVKNGANSISMPDEYVAVAHFIAYPDEYIAAQTAPVVPEGWKLVPVEPTKEMVQRACDDHGYPGGNRFTYVKGYRSMLSAAPSAPIQANSEDAKDAARYRVLRAGNDYAKDGAPMVLLYEKDSDTGERPFWSIKGEVLDDAIDRAIAATAQQKEGE